MSTEVYHEPVGSLAPATLDLHRALVSLQEELEAVDWYQQRAEGCTDDALRGVLLHNRDEEIEHAMMLVEWLRGHDAVFGANATRFLFGGGASPPGANGPKEVEEIGGAPIRPAAAPPEILQPSLGIGSLKGTP